MNERAASRLAIVSLCLLPLLWLWPCVFGGRTFVSFDLAEYPPAGQLLTAEQLASVRDGANKDVTEVPVWFVPELELAGAELRAGRLPTWNPHARGGTPLHAHGLIGLCYPPNWLALFAADPASRLVFMAWISLALGGLLAFGLLREVGLPVLAAWFGAMLFQLSGPMASNAFFWMRLASFVWLPGVLWALLCLARHDTLRPGPLTATAGAMAMAWLGGFPPFATTTSLIAGCLCLWLIGERARAANARQAARLGLRLALGLGLGAMLAMPQVLPSLQFFPHSARTPDPKLADIAGSAYEIYGLTGYLLPDLISHPSAVHELPYDRAPMALLCNTRRLENGSPAHPNYNYTEYAVFVGTLGFLLAVFGAVFARGRRRAFALTMFLLLLSLALFVPGVRLLFALPIVKNVWPMRWLAPATLFVAWLAALGLERVAGEARRLLWWPAACSLALAALVWFATSRPGADPGSAVHNIAEHFGVTAQGVVNHVQALAPPGVDCFAIAFRRAAEQGQAAAMALVLVAAWLIALSVWRAGRARTALLLAGCAATALQLGWHGSTVTNGVARSHSTQTAVHTFLRERGVEAAPSGGFTIVRASVEPAQPAQLPPGQLLAPGVRDLHFYTHYDGRSIAPIRALLGKKWGDEGAAKGYLTLTLPDRLPTPVQTAAAATQQAPETYAFESPLTHPLLDLLGVRYVLATEALQHAGALVDPEHLGASGKWHGKFFVYERPHPLPRAFTVPELRPLGNDAAVIAALVDPQFEPRRVAYVTADELPDSARETTATAEPRTVRFVRDHPNAVELDIAAGPAPWLVLTDTWLPGWTATVDGSTTPIVRTNHSQRAVHLPPQACRVRFLYTAPGLAAGTILAAFATLALLAFAVVRRRADFAAAAH